MLILLVDPVFFHKESKITNPSIDVIIDNSLSMRKNFESIEFNYLNYSADELSWRLSKLNKRFDFKKSKFEMLQTLSLKSKFKSENRNLWIL